MAQIKEAPTSGRSKTQNQLYHKQYSSVAERLADEPLTLLQKGAFFVPWGVLGFAMGWCL